MKLSKLFLTLGLATCLTTQIASADSNSGDHNKFYFGVAGTQNIKQIGSLDQKAVKIYGGYNYSPEISFGLHNRFGPNDGRYFYTQFITEFYYKPQMLQNQRFTPYFGAGLGSKQSIDSTKISSESEKEKFKKELEDATKNFYTGKFSAGTLININDNIGMNLGLDTDANTTEGFLFYPFVGINFSF